MTQDFSLTEKYMDLLLPYCPDFDPFDIRDVIRKLQGVDQSDKILMNKNFVEITTLLTDQFKYADETTPNTILIRLNALGRQVKDAGGHFAYLKPQQDKVVADQKRQELKDNADELDFKKKKWEYKNRRLPYFLSSLSLVGSIISIIIAYKSLQTKQAQPDLQPMQQEIQLMEEKLQKIDSLIQADTVLKKRILISQ
jgi:hypothetical protein